MIIGKDKKEQGYLSDLLQLNKKPSGTKVSYLHMAYMYTMKLYHRKLKYCITLLIILCKKKKPIHSIIFWFYNYI